jgi:GNAT superfamily N-acetyltransferase
MGEITFRPATESDLAAIVAMLADDHLGAQRESLNDLAPYEQALAVITSDPRLLQVICERDGAIVGTMQLTLVPGLSRQGMTRLQIEGVRVHADHRSSGIGGEMIHWAVAYGRDHGCGLVELTTDKSRADAHRFYERLGFVQSHLGYKLKLD